MLKETAFPIWERTVLFPEGQVQPWPRPHIFIFVVLQSTLQKTGRKSRSAFFFFFFNWGKCFRRRKFSVLGTCQFFSKKIPSSIPRLKKRWRYKSLYFLYLLHLVPISLIENASSFNLQEIQISTFQKFWTFSRVI